MKKSIYFVAAMLILVSCYPTDSYLHFVVKITDNIKAVISINTSPHHRCWSGNEEITILSATEDNRSGVMDDVCDDALYALYPADMEATLVETKIYTTLPPYRDCSDVAEPIMVATCDDDICFEDVSGMLCLNISSTIEEELLLRSVTLSSMSQAISGRVEIDCNDLSMNIVDQEAYAISLQSVDVAITAEPQEFYIAMPPLDFADGELCVTFEFEGCTHTAVLPALTLQRGVVNNVSCAF